MSSPSAPTASGILCDTPDTLASALTALRDADLLFLDCEGVNMGRVGGSLSVISLALPVALRGGSAERDFDSAAPPPSPSAQIFLIDVLSLDRLGSISHLRPLFDILELPHVTKVVFDGRMDYSALRHGYQVELNGLLDLQLADVASRRVRGEDEDEQFERLDCYIRHGELYGNTRCYSAIHRLSGLEFCAREHGVPPAEEAQDRLLSSLLRQEFHYNWDNRPLSAQQVEYAMKDVDTIQRLYAKLKQESLIDEQVLRAQTRRYMSLMHVQPPSQGGCFSNPLLPLYILDAPPTGGPTLSCMTCHRSLPSYGAFSVNARNFPQRRRCWVCLAIYKVDLRQATIDREREREDEYGYYDYDSDY